MTQIVKWSCIFVLLLSVLLESGCGYKDIDKRFFVVSIGVDTAKNSKRKYNVHLKLAVTNIASTSSHEFMIISAQADSISEAVRIMKSKVERELDFSHTKVIVLSEEIVKKRKNAGIYYWFARRRDIQEIAWIVIGHPNALEVLKAQPKSERLPSNAIFLALGKDGSETPYVIPEFLFSTKKRLIERGLDPILPYVKAGKVNFEINQVGLLDKSHMKILLSTEETKHLTFMLNKEQKAAIWAKKGPVKFTIDTQKVKTKYKIYTPKGKQPYIKVDLSVKGRIEETSRKITIKELSGYEKATEKRLNGTMKKTLTKIQKEKVDPVGFGLHYRARHFSKNDWKEWQQIYPQIKFIVHTKVQIEDTGNLE